MGPSLGAAFQVLSHDVLLAFANRAMYQELYGQSERVELLREVAGGFFGLLQRTLLLDILLQLARLVDRPETGGKPNLTLQSLPALVSDPALRLEIEDLVRSACDACVSAVDWRNRRLAHRDRPIALGMTDAALPGVTLPEIDKVLAIFATLLNRVESHFENGATTMYESVQGISTDSLFHFLKVGLDAEA